MINSLDRSDRPTPLVRWIFLALILALSAIIQFTVVTRSETFVPLRADAGHYFSYAYNLKHSGVYSGTVTWNGPAPAIVPDSIATPGYPLFLLMVPDLQPNADYLLRVGLAQAALGVLSVWLVYLITARFLGPAPSLTVALLTAISPHLATMSTYVLTESLFFFLLLTSLYTSLVAMRTQNRWALLGAGLLWGVCSLVRPTVQFLPPLFLLAAFALPRLRQHRTAAVLLFSGFLAAQAPWIVRNQLMPEGPAQPNLVVSFLHHGSYPGFMYDNRPETYGYPYRFDPNNERITRDVQSVLANIADHFRQQPLTYANWYLIGKPGKFLSWGIINGFGDIYTYPPNRSPYLEDLRFAVLRMLMLYLHWPLMLLGLAGAFAVWWRPRQLGLDDKATFAARMVSAVALYAVAFHMIGAPFPRYGIPFRPLFYMLAALLACGLFSRITLSRKAAVEA